MTGDRLVVELRPNVWLTSDGTGSLNEAIRFKTDHAAHSALSDARLHQPFMKAKVRKFGSRIVCADCGKPKVPRGRDLSTADLSQWCYPVAQGKCPGYHRDPEPGTMWPREVERG